jgi:hypothetical protein
VASVVCTMCGLLTRFNLLKESNGFWAGRRGLDG